MINIKNYDFYHKLCSLPFIKEIWLFGSRARGDNNERSDFDLAIICNEGTSDGDWQQVSDIINNADTLLKIDYIRFDKLAKDDVIRENIFKYKKAIYVKGENPREEIFWADYFNSLGNAIKRLVQVVKREQVEKNDYIQDAAIQRFEFVIEHFWKLLKKILSYEKVEANTPREVLSKSFQFKLIDDEAIWLKMLDDRNNTSHVYNEEDAKQVFINIQSYLPVLEKTYNALKTYYQL